MRVNSLRSLVAFGRREQGSIATGFSLWMAEAMESVWALARTCSCERKLVGLEPVVTAGGWGRERFCGLASGCVVIEVGGRFAGDHGGDGGAGGGEHRDEYENEKKSRCADLHFCWLRVWC